MADYVSGTPVPPVPVAFTDDPLVVDSQLGRRVHLTELRSALEALDGHYHVFHGNNSNSEMPATPTAWGDPTVNIVIDETLKRAEHIQELIDALKSLDGHTHVVPAFGSTSSAFAGGFAFQDDPVNADDVLQKRAAWQELRTHLVTLSTHTHIACCECECTCTCTCTCTCQCQEDCCAECDIAD